MRYRTFIVLALLAPALRFSAVAADVVSTWTTAASAPWNVDASWSNTPALGGFPHNGNGGVSTYDAAINATGSAYTITASTPIAIQDLLLGSANATLSPAGGVTTAGLFTWNSGILSGGTITANGGIALSGTSGMIMGSGATLNNTGACVASTNNTITYGGIAPCIINNSGTFTRNTATGTFALTSNVRMNNTGTVTVALGTLQFDGAVSQYSAGTLSGGTWIIMANSTLTGGGFANITINNAVVSLIGANSNFPRLNPVTTNNGTIMLSGSRSFITSVTTNFTNSGTITAATGSTFSTPFTFTWSGGTLDGGGTFNANGATTMSGSAGKTASGSTYNNNNALTMTGSGALTLMNGETFKNVGSFIAQSDAGIVNGSGSNVFNNTGTFTRNTSPGTFVIAPPFNNTGTVNANTGTLLLNGTVTQFNAGTLTAGTWNVAANSTLGGSGVSAVTTNNGIVTLNGPLSTFAVMDSLTTNTGTFGVTAGRNFTTAGQLSNTGTLISGAGSVFAISGLFNWTAGTLSGGGTFNANAGLAMTGSAGTTLNGSTLSNPSGQIATASIIGALSLTNNATFANAGTFLAQSDSGIVSGTGNNVFNNTGVFTRNTSSGTYVVAGTFNNSGTVNVTSGTLQFNGTAFQSAAGQTIAQGGSVTFNSSFVNDGSVIVTGTTALTCNGPVTNNGFIQIRGGGIFGGASASFINNGTLDIITASAVLPPGFVNNGIVLDSRVVKIKQATLAGLSFTALIDSYTGHNYQLQRSTSLTSDTFASIGAPQAGSTGTTLSFNDPSASPTACFYRVLINP